MTGVGFEVINDSIIVFKGTHFMWMVKMLTNKFVYQNVYQFEGKRAGVLV